MADPPQALPPYRRIAAKIRARIDAGELRPGDHIPSVRDIVRTEGVSAATATRVAAELRAGGYVESVPGIGTIVATRDEDDALLTELRRLRARAVAVDGPVEEIDAVTAQIQDLANLVLLKEASQ